MARIRSVYFYKNALYLYQLMLHLWQQRRLVLVTLSEALAILLFLSYITSNLGILSGIRKAAEEHMQEWDEFDIDKCNVGFIFNLDCPRNETLPSEKERRSKEQREERFEKNASQEDRIERKELYSYNRDDINTEDYKIGQALRFMELICKILPGFNHRLTSLQKARHGVCLSSHPCEWRKRPGQMRYKSGIT